MRDHGEGQDAAPPTTVKGATLGDLLKATGRRITGAFDLIANLEAKATATLLQKAIAVNILDSPIGSDLAGYFGKCPVRAPGGRQPALHSQNRNSSRFSARSKRFGFICR